MRLPPSTYTPCAAANALRKTPWGVALCAGLRCCGCAVGCSAGRSEPPPGASPNACAHRALTECSLGAHRVAVRRAAVGSCWQVSVLRTWAHTALQSKAVGCTQPPGGQAPDPARPPFPATAARGGAASAAAGVAAAAGVLPDHESPGAHTSTHRRHPLTHSHPHPVLLRAGHPVGHTAPPAVARPHAPLNKTCAGGLPCSRSAAPSPCGRAPGRRGTRPRRSRRWRRSAPARRRS